MVNMGAALLGLDIGAFIAGKILVICVFMAATFSRHLNLRTGSKVAVGVAGAVAGLGVIVVWTMVAVVGPRNAALRQGYQVVQPSVLEAASTAFSGEVIQAAFGGAAEDWMVPGIYTTLNEVPTEDRVHLLSLKERPNSDADAIVYGSEVTSPWEFVWGVSGGEPHMVLAPQAD